MSYPIDSRVIAQWRFDEPADEVRPVDDAGNLEDLTTYATLTAPAVGDAALGLGRVFATGGPTGLGATDSNDDLVITRNLSIVAALKIDSGALDTAGAPGTIVWHGDSPDGTFGLRVESTDFANSQVLLALCWYDEAGALVVDTGAVVTWADGDEYLVAAIREMEGDALKVTYVVNGESIESSTTYAIDVATTATGEEVYVGVEPNGGGYQNHLAGTLSFLAVYNDALAVEELQLAWQLLSEDFPAVLLALQKLLPEDAFSELDTSLIQRELRVEATTLASVRNSARRLREYYLPGASVPETLALWEKLTNRRQFARDSIDDRQARVESYLQGAFGYSTDDLKTQMLEFLGYTDVADIDVVVGSVGHTEDFASATAPGADDAIISEGNASFSISSGNLRMASTAADIEFDKALTKFGYHLWSFSGQRLNHRDAFFGGDFTRVATADNGFAGVIFGRRDTNTFGMIAQWRLLSVFRLAHLSYAPATGLVNEGTLETSWDEDDTFLRLRAMGDDTFQVQWGTSDAAAKAQSPTIISGPRCDYAGFFVASSSGSVTQTFDFNTWYSHEVSGVQALNYYLYRDPADGGEYDVEGAHRLLQQVGPAHYNGAVIDQQTLACDDTDTGCDRQPMGL